MKIARITLSDRAFAGEYEDWSGPAIETVLNPIFPYATFLRILLPDERLRLAEELRRLTDSEKCALIVTTGGTGPSARDITPEATRDVLEKELPGFGEVQRALSFAKVPTAILTRATAGIRNRSLIVNLPGNPKAIGECLTPLLPAIREALDHLGWTE
jgi:molybdopterin adenylyltransferase